MLGYGGLENFTEFHSGRVGAPEHMSLCVHRGVAVSAGSRNSIVLLMEECIGWKPSVDELGDADMGVKFKIVEAAPKGVPINVFNGMIRPMEFGFKIIT